MKRSPAVAVPENLDPADPRFKPRTELGRLLQECRRRIIESGEPLLDWDDLEREVAERRGGVWGGES